MKIDHKLRETKTDKARNENKHKKNRQNITEIAIAAREEGMSYGQYVAKYNL